MPLTGALLNDVERDAFGAWLSRRLDESRKSKNAVMRATGVPIVRLNCYLGGEIPLAPTLARVAAAVGVAWPTAFVRAGYFREVLAGLEAIASAAPEPNKRSGARRALVDFPLVNFALRAFPWRDRSATSALGSDAELGSLLEFIVPFEDLGKPRHPMLARAAKVLDDRATPTGARRAIAGEFVMVWAEDFDPDAAAAVREGRTLRLNRRVRERAVPVKLTTGETL